VTTAIPLFGTNIANHILYYLIQDERPVKLWLDKDQEGLVQSKATHLSGLLGRPVDLIITNKDPKTYSLEELKQYA
jgi:hypothetical protein